MSTQCRLDMLPRTIEASMEDFENAPIRVFFALGIVNPMGPTLTVVATLGQMAPGRILPVVVASLNPFTQTVTQVARLHVGERWVPLDLLMPLTHLELGSCPTLVLTSDAFDEEDRLVFTQRLLERFSDDTIEIYASLKAHPADPWTRVSEEMQGKSFGKRLGLTLSQAAASMARVVQEKAHFDAELKAFVYAWNGSIEETGLPQAMKLRAMSTETFTTILTTKLLPTAWLPGRSEEEHDAEDDEANGADDSASSELGYDGFEGARAADGHRDNAPREPPAQPKIATFEEMKKILATRSWESLHEDNLADLLRWLLYCVGKGDKAWLTSIGPVYTHALSHGVDRQARMTLQGEMVECIEQGKLQITAFLPFVMFDTDEGVATKATVDMVSMSAFQRGELQAATELRPLFARKGLANRAAVFGALVAIGDAEAVRLATEFKPLLTAQEHSEAARVRTGFPQDATVQFWLSWAEELVADRSEEGLGRFGAGASALVLVLRDNLTGAVQRSQRAYPVHKHNPAIRILDSWPVDEYAQRIAPRLYALEAAEAAPRVFSEVLRAWGLKPRAPVQDQFLPDAGTRGMSGDFARLRDPDDPGGGTPQSFLRRLIGH